MLLFMTTSGSGIVMVARRIVLSKARSQQLPSHDKRDSGSKCGEIHVVTGERWLGSIGGAGEFSFVFPGMID